MTGALLALLLLPAAPAGAGCPGLVEHVSEGMGTRVTVLLCPREPSAASIAEADAKRAVVELRRLEALWSRWVPESDVSRLNSNAGSGWVEVAPETAALLSRSRAASEQTDGVFDVTFAPLLEVWRFDAPKGDARPRLTRLPSRAEVAARLARVGWRDLHVEGQRARLGRPGMAVGLGGVGKGAAVDAAVALLRRAGYANFAIQAGGDLYCGGRNGQRPWRIAVRHPRISTGTLGSVEVRDAAFSTSGDYERFGIVDGKRYHHLIDLRTGWPATASQSATVLAPTATDAEVLTKVAFVLGGAEGIRAVEAAGGKVVVVDAAGRVHWSKGLPRLREEAR